MLNQVFFFPQSFSFFAVNNTVKRSYLVVFVFSWFIAYTGKPEFRVAHLRWSTTLCFNMLGSTEVLLKEIQYSVISSNDSD